MLYSLPYEYQSATVASDVVLLSNAFALATSCASNKIHIIEKIFKLYMNKLENWLIKWRLSINPNKCQIILFNRGKSEKINIALLNENIPVTNEIKFLGLIIDRTMHFTNCIKDIKIKCNNRLNILKILSHKSWNLTSKTLCCIYQILIRSIIDYASVIFNMLNETNKKKLRSIQYHALRHAMRKPLKASHSELLEISKICSIDKRCYELNEKYLVNAFKFRNELIIDLANNYLNWYPINRTPKIKTILCFYRECINKTIENQTSE